MTFISSGDNLFLELLATFGEENCTKMQLRIVKAGGLAIFHRLNGSMAGYMFSLSLEAQQQLVALLSPPIEISLLVTGKDAYLETKQLVKDSVAKLLIDAISGIQSIPVAQIIW